MVAVGVSSAEKISEQTSDLRIRPCKQPKKGCQTGLTCLSVCLFVVHEFPLSSRNTFTFCGSESLVKQSGKELDVRQASCRSRFARRSESGAAKSSAPIGGFWKMIFLVAKPPCRLESAGISPPKTGSSFRCPFKETPPQNKQGQTDQTTHPVAGVEGPPFVSTESTKNGVSFFPRACSHWGG